MPRKKTDPIERFDSKIITLENGCWFWTGFKNPAGYGTFPVTPKFTMMAHRYAYELHVGPIPKGLQIDHLCRNRACVNPAHLEAVTAMENTMRGFGPAALNTRKTHCPKGHPYEGENLAQWQGQLVGRRYCRECQRAHNRNVYRRLYASPNYTPRYREA